MERDFRRSFDSLAEVFDLVGDYFVLERIDPSFLFVIRLAAEELFTNMVKYNPGGSSDIKVGLRREGNELLLTLEDFDVEEFDVTRVPAPKTDAPLEERQPGGLGLHLIRTLTDGMAYSYLNRHCRITVIKRMG